MEKYNKIVFVCTGNTCRSPMAEALFRKYSGTEEIACSSRGLLVFGEMPASENAVNVMKEYGIDISSHRSRYIESTCNEERTLILTMTERHKEVLKQHGFECDIFQIKEFVGSKGDVEDPYGQDIDAYRQCAGELEKLIKEIGGKLQR